ncbi:MAG: transketolase [Anaerolineaceae bacterium]|nr:transketolase [Anaerolineaceae bacterium]
MLMYRVMRWDPADPWDLRSDRLVLSEGHAVPIIYAACMDLGVVVGRDRQSARPLSVDEVADLRKAESVLDGHPNPVVGFPLFDAATGSLGQGLSAGAGLALAAKMAGTRRRVFVICGDGEMREGQTAEAIDFAKDHNPGNLVLVVNCNGQGQSDYVSPQQSLGVLSKKLKAAGWAVREVDGHDVERLEAALGRLPKSKPLAVLCRTRKGWGVQGLQAVDAHGKALSNEKAKAAIEELALPPRLAEVDELLPPKPRGRKVKRTPDLVGLGSPDFSEAIKDGRLATRKAYGIGLRELGRRNPQVVVLDADVQGSTFANYFHQEFPERFFECKIAEQNMVSAAGGLAAGGLLPFANTFGKFFARAYDQIEMAAIGGLNIKLTGSHSGVTLAADGPSQMALTDLAFLRSMSHVNLIDGRPMLRLLLPADAMCAYRCVELAARHEGLVYIRTLRPELPLLYQADETFEMGGAKVLRQGDDLTLVGSCYTVHVALAVAEQLAGHGVGCRVVDCYSLPISDPAVLAMARDPNDKLLVLDDSYVGAVGSELAEVAAAWQGARVVVMAVCRTPKSARRPQEVLRQVGLGTEAILARARELVQEDD